MSPLSTHQVQTFHSPVPSSAQVNATVVRGNDNVLATALNAHDGDASIHVQSGLLSARPAAPAIGSMYVATDTALAYLYTSSGWLTLGDSGQSARRWIAVSDYTTQTLPAINTPGVFTFNTVDTSDGVTLDVGLTNSKLTVTQAGVYNLQWSGQFTNTDSQIHDVDIWVSIDGSPLVGSTGTVSIPNKHGSVNGNALPSWNYLLSLTAGQYIQLQWAVNDLGITLTHQPATAVHPSTASVIATLTKV